jgi:hypothetical protein
MRPVPVVFLLFAFSDQLYFLTLAAGYPQDAQVCFWMWKERRPQRRHKVCDLLWRFPNEEVPFVILVGW